MRTTIFIILIALSSIVSYTFAQGEKKHQNKFGIEEGVGYNTLTFKYTNIGQPGFKSNYAEHASNFCVQLNARIFYSISIHTFSNSLHKKLMMPVFIGYYTFGGVQNVSGAGTMDVPPSIISPNKITTLFRSIETGINPCFEINNIQIGLLLKAQYILSVKEKFHYDNYYKHTIEEMDASSNYKKIAMNTGIKLKYKIKKFSIAAETYFGITNLYDHSTYGDDGKLRVTENNYRLLLGYEF